MIYCLDTETTGLHPEYGDEIVQLSIVDAMSKEVVLDEYFRPSDDWMQRGWAEASQVTGITPDTVQDCRSLHDEDVHYEISNVLRRADTIVGYHVAFDAKMMSASAGFDMSAYSFEDPMYSFALYYGLTHPDEDYCSRSGRVLHHAGWLPWKHEYVNRNLTFAADYFGIRDFGAHNSLNDVLATIEVWQNMNSLQMELLSSNTIEYDGRACCALSDRRTGESYPLVTPDGRAVNNLVESYRYSDLLRIDSD